MIQASDAKFEDYAKICFWAMLLTGTTRHTHRPNAKNVIFRFGGMSKRGNPLKSPLRKFDSKTMLSQPTGKRK